MPPRTTQPAPLATAKPTTKVASLSSTLSHFSRDSQMQLLELLVEVMALVGQHPPLVGQKGCNLGMEGGDLARGLHGEVQGQTIAVGTRG